MTSLDDVAVLTGHTVDDVARMTECTASDVAVDVAADVDESETDMWHSAIGWKGAMWPNHGLPRDTPVLANKGYVKSFLEPEGFEPRTSSHRYAFVITNELLDHWIILVM
jgi:hypothetical protein